MDTNQYCINLSSELQRWRDAIHKENEIISKIPSAEKQHFQACVADLQMLECEMDERIHQLKNECPTYWGPENAEHVIEPGGEAAAFALSPEESEKIIGGGNLGG